MLGEYNYGDLFFKSDVYSLILATCS